jgi:hypothetical protein
VVTGLYNGFIEGRKYNFVSAVQKIALAVFAYSSTTPKFHEILSKYFYRFE